MDHGAPALMPTPTTTTLENGNATGNGNGSASPSSDPSSHLLPTTTAPTAAAAGVSPNPLKRKLADDIPDPSSESQTALDDSMEDVDADGEADDDTMGLMEIETPTPQVPSQSQAHSQAQAPAASMMAPTQQQQHMVSSQSPRAIRPGPPPPAVQQQMGPGMKQLAPRPVAPVPIPRIGGGGRPVGGVQMGIGMGLPMGGQVSSSPLAGSPIRSTLQPQQQQQYTFAHSPTPNPQQQHPAMSTPLRQPSYASPAQRSPLPFSPAPPLTFPPSIPSNFAPQTTSPSPTATSPFSQFNIPPLPPLLPNYNSSSIRPPPPKKPRKPVPPKDRMFNNHMQALFNEMPAHIPPKARLKLQEAFLKISEKMWAKSTGDAPKTVELKPLQPIVVKRSTVEVNGGTGARTMEVGVGVEAGQGSASGETSRKQSIQSSTGEQGGEMSVDDDEDVQRRAQALLDIFGNFDNEQEKTEKEKEGEGREKRDAVEDDDYDAAEEGNIPESNEQSSRASPMNTSGLIQTGAPMASMNGATASENTSNGTDAEKLDEGAPAHDEDADADADEAMDEMVPSTAAPSEKAATKGETQDGEEKEEGESAVQVEDKTKKLGLTADDVMEAMREFHRAWVECQKEGLLG